MTTNDTKATFTIPLSRDYVARLSEIDRDLTEMLDPKDATRVKAIKYTAVSNGKNYYAFRSVPGDNKKKEYLARLIKEKELRRALLKTEKVIFVSHLVNDKELDYTRDNLRVVNTNNSRSRKKS